MAVIDFRVRPIVPPFEVGFPEPAVQWFFDSFGYEVKGAAKERTEEALVKELKETGIVKAVVPGRALPGFTNEGLIESTKIDPEIFVPFPFLDVTDPEKALEDIDKYIINGPGRGASMEPLAGNDVRIDDESLDPVYKKLEENNIPLLVTVSGFIGKYVDNTMPHQIDVILSKFPNLVYVAAHAGWPWFDDMTVIAFRHRNLFLTADFEGTHGAGSEILREATVHMLKNQVIFASSFPLGPIADGVQSVRDWKLPKDVEQKVLYDNAAKILGLE